MGTCKITVNGKAFELINGTEPELKYGTLLTYGEVVSLAGYKPDRILSVTYSKAVGDKSKGILSPKESIRIQDGTLINVADTSQA